MLRVKGDASPAIAPVDSGLGSDYGSKTRKRQKAITNLTLAVEALKSSVGENRSVCLYFLVNVTV